MINLKKLIAVALTVLAFALLVPCVFADESTAKDIVKQCKFSSSAYTHSTKLLYDGSLELGYKTKKSESGNYLEIVFPEGESVQGMYIKWEKHPGEWELWCSFGSEFEFVRSCGSEGFVQEYIALPEGSVGAKIICDNGKENVLSILELAVYTPGNLPETVHIWNKSPKTVDFLVVSTHQDDEVLFFGGTIPYYAGEKDIDTMVVYMTFDEGRRLHEACDALWYGGCRFHPEFAMFPDKYSLTLNDAKKAWDEDEVTNYLTEIVLSYRPNVILTQHTKGEYGHGQHQLMVHCLKNAVENAASENFVAENFSEYSVWDTPKFYMHALPEDCTMKVMWDEIILESFGGITALDAAQRSFELHVSQNYANGFRIHYDTGDKSDCTLFTLYRSKVGADKENNDFFENIGLRAARADIPEADLAYIENDPTFFKAGEKNLYATTRDGDVTYIRYCSSNNVTGWFVSDEYGTVIEPVQIYQLVPVQQEELPSNSDLGSFGSVNDGISTALCILSVAAIAAVIIALIKSNGSKRKSK